MNILFDCYAIDIQMENHLHCIVPNDEIMKFNKWSVVKFIFQRLVRYNQGLTGRVFQLRVGSGSGIGKNYRVGSGSGSGSGIGNIY